MLFTSLLSYAAYSLVCDVNIWNEAIGNYETAANYNIDMGGKEEEWVHTPFKDQMVGWRVDFRFVESSYWVWGDTHTFDAHFYLDGKKLHEMHGEATWGGTGPFTSSYYIVGEDSAKTDYSDDHMYRFSCNNGHESQW